MTARMFAAGLAAIVGIGFGFAPIETSAGPTGPAGQPSHGAALRAPVMPPAARAAPPSAGRHHFAPMRGAAPHSRRAAGFGVTGGWGGYGAYYDPSNQSFVLDPVAPQAAPVQGGAPVVSEHQSLTIRVVPAIYDYNLGCQSQTQNVTGGSGGERTITITRC